MCRLVSLFSAPILAVTETGQMLCAWNYINPERRAPFGHGVALTRFNDGQWNSTMEGFNLEDTTVAAGPVVMVIPGKSTYLVVFNRIVLPTTILIEPSLANAAGGELFFSTVSASTDKPPEPVRLTDNNVMDGSPSLHESAEGVVLTYLRQSTANIEDPSFSILLRHFHADTSTWTEEVTVAVGSYGGPAKYVQTVDGNEIVAFLQQNVNADGFFTVYSCRLTAQTTWSTPARIDLTDGTERQKDVQLLSGRPDGKVLVGWLCESTPYYRLLSFPDHEQGQAYLLRDSGVTATSRGVRAFATETLLAVRAPGHGVSYFATLDSELDTTSNVNSNRTVYTPNRVLNFHAIPDNFQKFDPAADAMPIAQSSPVDKKETRHTLVYDGMHSRIIVGTQEELKRASGSPASNGVRNLRVDTIGIQPDLAVENITMDPATRVVEFRIANHGLLTANASQVELFFGDIGRVKFQSIKTFSLQCLRPGATKSFRFTTANISLPHNSFARIWASVALSFKETTTENNHKSVLPTFSTMELQDANWQIKDSTMLQIDTLIRTNTSLALKGEIGVVVCTRKMIQGGNGDVYNKSWQIVGQSAASFKGGVGSGSVSIPVHRLLSNEVLVVLVHDEPTFGIDGQIEFDPTWHKKAQTKQIKVPFTPNLFVSEETVHVSQSNRRQNLASVIALVENGGLSPVVNASVEIWLADPRSPETLSPTEQAYTGILLHRATVDIGVRQNATVAFDTDALKSGHSKVVVLVNEERRIKESAYADNTVLQHVYIAASANIQIDTRSVALVVDKPAISVVVQNLGGEDLKMGSLFALMTNSGGITNSVDHFKYEVLGEPTLASIPAGSEREVRVAVSNLNMLTACTYQTVVLAFIDAGRVVDGELPLAIAIADQIGLPTASVAFLPLETLMQDSDICNRLQNEPTVADNRTLTVFRDTPMYVKCDGYDPEGDPFACTITSLDMESGTLWQLSGASGNVSQQIKSSDLPVAISGLTVIYAPTSGSFWGTPGVNVISYELAESEVAGQRNTSEPTSGLARSSHGTITIQNVPYSSSQFQTADLQTCQRLCHAYPRCNGVEFSSVASYSKNCKIIDTEIDISVGDNTLNEDTIMCYAKNEGNATVVDPHLLVQILQGELVDAHYGFDAHRNGSCSGTDVVGTDASADDSGVTEAVVAVLLLVCATVIAGVFYWHRQKNSERYALQNMASSVSSTDQLVANALFDIDTSHVEVEDESHDRTIDAVLQSASENDTTTKRPQSMYDSMLANASSGFGAHADVATNAVSKQSVVVPLTDAKFESTASIFGEVSREKATKMLQDNVDGTFLIRAKGDAYVLSMLSNSKVRHHKLSNADGSFTVNGSATSHACATLSELIAHLSVHPEGGTNSLLASVVVPTHTGGQTDGATQVVNGNTVYDEASGALGSEGLADYDTATTGNGLDVNCGSLYEQASSATVDESATASIGARLSLYDNVAGSHYDGMDVNRGSLYDEARSITVDESATASVGARLSLYDMASHSGGSSLDNVAVSHYDMSDSPPSLAGFDSTSLPDYALAGASDVQMISEPAVYALADEDGAAIGVPAMYELAAEGGARQVHTWRIQACATLLWSRYFL